MKGRLLLFSTTLAILVNFGYAEPVGICPEENEEYVTFLTDSEDCSIFYKCHWGVPYKYNCSTDLYFNPDLNVCDYTEQTECGSTEEDNIVEGGDNNDNANNSEENGENNGNDGEVTDGDNGNGDSGNNGDSAVGDCPVDNDSDAVHLPHESDCTLFYKCDWGVPVLQECPDDLHFNPVLKVCDYPEDAGCESGTGGNDVGSEDNGNGEDNGNEGGDSDGDSDNGDSGNNGDGVVGECPADNDGDAVHLPHESDCTLFYKCDWGVPVLQKCPDGLHFNPVLEVCDYSEDASCESGTGGSDGESEDNSNGEDNGNEGGDSDGDSTNGDNGNNGDDVVVECPADNDGDAVHLPHESDCTLFYKCDWGVPVLHKCPDGLHFNPVLEVCDYSEDAGCQSGTEGSDGESEDNGNGEDNGNEGGDSEGDSDHGDSGSNGDGVVGECPTDNDGYAVHLPHESDCTLFYKCDWGVPVLQKCPDGLHFNPVLEVCDYSEDAGCESGTGGSDGESEDNSNGEDNGNEGGDSDNGDSENNGDGVVGECPAGNDGDAVHLPHESDCTLFYKCDWGVPVLQKCPDGLHFNPVLGVCDYSEDAGCESGTGGSDGESEDNSNGEDNGNGGGDSDGDSDNGDGGSNGDGVVGECPADNDGDAVHLPHESDCTLFYKCDWGVPVLQECPDGLHFNPVLEVCDYSEDAGCESVTGGSDGGSEDNGNGQDNGNEGEDSDGDSDNGVNGNNGDGVVGECPADNDGDAVHLPHESDCTLFYKCDWGVPVLQECPDGLHFNPVLEVCDYSEDAGCESVTGGSDGGSEDNGNGQDNGNEGEDSDGDSDNGVNGNNGDGVVGECPADNDGDAVHLPHESDCTLFYKCDWGVPVLQECPDGLHFNSALEVCDYPEDAGCESETGGSNEESEDNSNGEDNGNDDDSDDGNDDESVDGGTGFCDTVSCPEENEEYVTFIPNTSDCTKFCKCNWGQAYEFICDDGLYFNPTLNVCDYQEDSGCST